MPVVTTQTRHYQLSVKLRELVGSMAPGTPLSTVRDLCQTFKVSQSTLEKALKPLRNEGLIVRPSNQKRLIAAAPARQPLARIALLHPVFPSSENHALVNAVIHAAQDHQQWAFDHYYFSDMSEIEFRRITDRSDAAVLLPSAEAFPENVLRYLQSPEKPLVVMQQRPPGRFKAHFVTVDDRLFGRLAFEQLWSLGHRQLTLILDQPPCASIQGRRRGWVEAHRRLSPDTPVSICDCSVKSGELPTETSYAGLNAWLDRHGPTPFTAVACTSIAGAMAALRTFWERGIRVPEDVSLVSYGGESTLSDFLVPPLTTIKVDMAAYGQTVATVLADCLDGHAALPRHRSLAPQLLARCTTRNHRDTTAAITPTRQPRKEIVTALPTANVYSP
jgi:DNA-binding LacI/PurR family transcriptional regulator